MLRQYAVLCPDPGMILLPEVGQQQIHRIFGDIIMTLQGLYVRPQPYRIDRTRVHRKCTKNESVWAANSRPYGSNVRCLKTIYQLASLCCQFIAFFCQKQPGQTGGQDCRFSGDWGEGPGNRDMVSLRQKEGSPCGRGGFRNRSGTYIDRHPQKRYNTPRKKCIRILLRFV